ncbi:hypothetical protein VP01_4172g1 [Puccinia sorghi]|uniref:Uncharacterized protein n=1 Tax=Puccinia sorghi TaxID=27349 RepID=A0A0L6UQW2_9BASI|nr:hypothetical protein VP01_4172g1 [Puccinia sorghi]
MSGLEKSLFQLKFTAKQLQKQSRKAAKDETAEKAKLKKVSESRRLLVRTGEAESHLHLWHIPPRPFPDGHSVSTRRYSKITLMVPGYMPLTRSHDGGCQGHGPSDGKHESRSCQYPTSLTSPQKNPSYSCFILRCFCFCCCCFFFSFSFLFLQIAMVMDKFESQFEDMDAQAGCMESAISQTTASSMPQDQVDLLMQKVADEAGLEIKHGLGEVPKSSVGVTEQEPVVANQEAPEDALAQRLKALRPAT